MAEGGDHALAWMRRLDAGLDRVRAVLEDRTGRLQRVENRLTSLAARFSEIETFDREVTRMDKRLDEHGRRLARIEDATVLAEPLG
jgi:predicted  nucleic acid-binding Zn-ribbon protein